MKRFIVLILATCYCLTGYTQAPAAFNYQAIMRDYMGEPIVDQEVNIRVSLHRNSENGEKIFSEIHQVATNSFGLINIKIGYGKEKTGELSSIDWGNGSVYAKTEIDINNTGNYHIMGSAQLLSVPYAMYANESGNTTSRSGEWTNNGNDIFTDETAFPDAKTGIGTTIPGGKLHIYGPGLTGPNRPMLLVEHQGGFSSTFRRNTEGPANALFLLQKSRGNLLNPAPVQNGDNIGQIRMEGFDGSEYKTAGWVRVIADGTPSSGIVPGALLFATTSNAGGVNERMRINSDGNVGIGTTDPQSELHVSGPDYSNVQFILAADDFPEFFMSESRSVLSGFRFKIDDEHLLNISSHNGATYYGTHLAISKYSPTSIGIACGLPINTLDINGEVAIGDNYAGSKDAPVNGLIVEGNVGIGKTLPTQKLDVNGTVKAVSFVGNGAGLTGIAGDNLGNHIASQNINLNGHYLSGDGANEGIFINSSGFAGIGLTNPNKPFYIRQLLNGLVYAIKVENKSADIGNSSTGILFSTGGSGDIERGKGAIVYQCTDTWNRGSFHIMQNPNTNTDNPLLISSHMVMTIANNGNVGIGSSVPQSKLNVNGKLMVGSTSKNIILRTDGSAVDLESTGNTLAINYSGIQNTSINNSAGGVAIGNLGFTNKLTVKGPGTETGGNSGYGEVVSRFQSTPNHTAISIDALTDKDPILYFSENGSAKWGIRNDADDDNLEFRFHDGGANTVLFRMNGAYLTAGGHIYVSADKQFDLGAYSTAWDDVYADDFHNRSLSREAVSRKVVPYGIEAVLLLKPSLYKDNSSGKVVDKVGLFADEVDRIIPEACLTLEGSQEAAYVNYDRLIPVLVKAIQEQQMMIEEMKEEIERMRED